MVPRTFQRHARGPSSALLVIAALDCVSARQWSPCWSGGFNVAACCLHAQLGEACWSGEFTYEACCLQGPLLSLEEGSRLRELTDTDLTCGCGAELAPTDSTSGVFEWCEFRRAVMLNWDLRPFYMPFTKVDLGALAACPIGVLTMLLFDTYLKLSSAHYEPNLSSMPSFLWADDAWDVLMNTGKVTTRGITESGWMPFFHLSSVRLALGKRGAVVSLGPTDPSRCAEVPSGGSQQTAWHRLQDAAIGQETLDFEAGLRLLMDGDGVGPCGLAKATVALASAYSLQQRLALPGGYEAHRAEVQRVLALGDDYMHQALKEVGGNRGLSLLVATPWPLVDQADLLCHLARVKVSVARPLEDLGMGADSPFRRLAERPSLQESTSPPWYAFRLFPVREMVSDMIRFSALPFCGLRPFMRMIASAAEYGLAQHCPTGLPPGQRKRKTDGKATNAVDGCSLTLVEGGPHLGDCAIWAAAALRLAGVELRALAFEPLPDASALFRRSVIENGLDGTVSVRTSALGASSKGTVDLVYFRGHNGQAM